MLSMSTIRSVSVAMARCAADTAQAWMVKQRLTQGCRQACLCMRRRLTLRKLGLEPRVVVTLQLQVALCHSPLLLHLPKRACLQQVRRGGEASGRSVGRRRDPMVRGELSRPAAVGQCATHLCLELQAGVLLVNRELVCARQVRHLSQQRPLKGRPYDGALDAGPLASSLSLNAPADFLSSSIAKPTTEPWCWLECENICTAPAGACRW